MDVTKDIMDKQNEGESIFLKIESGENKFRIVSGIKGVKEHKLEMKDGGWRFPICPKTQQEWINESYDKDEEIPKCPICAFKGINDELGKELGIRVQYFAMAIDRKTGELGILKQGKMMFEQIMKLNSDEDYGDVKEYDLKITRTGEKLTTKYTVIPVPKKNPLTDEELKLIVESDIDLDKMTIPNTYEKLVEIAGLEGKNLENPF